MATFFQSTNCIKYGQYFYDTGNSQSTVPEYKPTGSLLKWYNVKMSYEDKYRFGLLTYEEFCLWQQELMNEAMTLQTMPSFDEHFWDNDASARANLSHDDYSEFLANNNIDVSNNTTLDIDALLNEVPQALVEPTPAPEPDTLAIASEVSNDVDMDEILRNVTKDIMGESYLSQEEIDAMFAAANA